MEDDEEDRGNTKQIAAPEKASLNRPDRTTPSRVYIL
jgi:hypothetical protein